MRIAFTLAAILVACSTPVFAQEPDEQLNALTSEYHQRGFEESGRIARPDGSSEAGPQLGSVTPEDNLRRAADAKALLARLDALVPVFAGDAALAPTGKADRSDVLRAALLAGLQVLEGKPPKVSHRA